MQQKRRSERRKGLRKKDKSNLREEARGGDNKHTPRALVLVRDGATKEEHARERWH